jgi:hypothetical protein
MTDQPTQQQPDPVAIITTLQTQIQELQARLAQVAPVTTSSNVKPSKPEPFTGKRGESIDAWIFQVEQYMFISKVEESQRIMLAASFLKEHAALWWRNVYQENAQNGTTWTWHDFALNLRTQFRPVNATKLARDRLANLRQTQSVQAYVHAYRSLILDIPDMAENEKLDRFVRGLKERVRKEVELRDPTSLDEAIKIADRVDAITYNWRYPESEKLRTEAMGPTPMEIDAIRRPSLTTEERERLRRTGSCFYCREQGHMAAKCPKKQRQLNAIGSAESGKDWTQ